MKIKAWILYLLLVPGQVIGAPAVISVSGILQNGSSITLAGSSFGTKGVAAPIKFDDFETGSTGSQIANGWTADGASNCGAPIHRPIYSTTVLRTNSTKSVQCRFDEASDPGCGGDGAHYSSSFGIANVPNPGLPVIYMDGWCYYAPASPESRNVKLIRVHTAFNGSPNLFVNIYCNANSDGMRVDQSGGTTAQVYDGCDQHGCPFNFPWHGESWWAGNWRHFQMYLVQSSPGGNDGTMKLWTDGVLEPNSTSWNNRSTTTFWDTAFFGNYVGHDGASPCTSASPGNTFIYWDDAYVDSTLAHVELGNNPVYQNCTIREIQPITAWSSTSITVRGNKGSFSDFSSNYFFVVDRNGNVSAGFKPTIASPCTPL